MLTTRLWMGSLLIVLAAGMLVVDQHLAPVYPFLWLMVTGLVLAAWVELVQLLGPGRRPQLPTSGLGVFVLGSLNWLGHIGDANPWIVLLGGFVALVLAVFLWEIAFFEEASRASERMGLTLLVVAYLGLLPSFLVQLRWLGPGGALASAALAMAIFVPKACDIGAYFTGKLIGRHRMTPVLSPKKTWEGAIGGLITAALVAVALDRWTGAGVLRNNLAVEIGFGLIIGAAGMLGDLAESLLKRDCRHKDASQIVPGFGGVLDVLDAIIFSAPLSYACLKMLAD